MDMKPIILVSIITVSFLFASLANAFSTERTEKKISPLFKIRTLQSIEDKTINLEVDHLKERIFIWSLLKFLIENRGERRILKGFTVTWICTYNCKSVYTPVCPGIIRHSQIQQPLISRVATTPSYCIKCPS